MPFVQSFTNGSYHWEPPRVESRSDALGDEQPSSRVPPGLLAEVERTVRSASASLGIAAPKVRWLPKGSNPRGVVFAEALNEVWITLQEPAATRESALHELRHVFQLRDDRWVALGLETYEQRQADADQFARTWRPSFEYKAPDGQALAYKNSGPFEVKARGDTWEIAGYASTFAPPDAPKSAADSYGDLIVRGAFTQSIASRETKFLFEHREPIGKQLELREDSHGLFGRWSIVDTQAGSDARKLALAGVIDALSIGYLAKDTEHRSDGVRLIKQVDLFEVSAVAIPANPSAVITDVRSVAAPPERFDFRAEIRRRRVAGAQYRAALARRR